MDTGLDRNRSPLIMIARRGLLLAPLLFLGIFFFYPLTAIFGMSLLPDGALDLSGFIRIAQTVYYRETLWFTTWQAIVSTLLTVGLAVPAAYIFTKYAFPGKQLLLSLSTLAFVLPTVVVASGFSALLGPRGLLNDMLMGIFDLSTPPLQLQHTLTIILIAHVFYNFAVALRIITGFWINQGTHIEEAARILGCRGWRLWWEIRLPLLRPAILSAAALVYIFTFTSFGVVLILGGPRFATLEVEIYRQAVNLFNLPVAAALSLVQIVFMFALLAIYTRLQRQTPSEIQGAEYTARRPKNWRERIVVGGVVSTISALIIMPLAALVIRSLVVNGRITFDAYMALTTTKNSLLFVPPLQTAGNSLGFAIVTTGLALILGTTAAYMLTQPHKRIARWLDPVVMLPLATSPVTLGFGFIIALAVPPLALRSTWMMVVIAHTLVAMPFVVRSILPALRRISPSLRESAMVLGASQTQVFRWVDLPLVSRGLAVGAVFAFTVSMGEFGASLFVVRPDSPTLPMAIFRLLSQPGAMNFQQAMALSVVLMVVCAAGFAILERMRDAGAGEF